ncbi:MAG TPA: tRNA uridine-5-carboxymethylaminomethyl(34) synthesis enzyme MnmG, partial [Bacillota bacterium]|nr:tRNA uridine-5-carboxymethylaminomethyl(34) synthesis enzyme MnmG [Bacillota bacterium]
LVLRQDNADIRLTEKSYILGLASKERYKRVIRKKEIIGKEEKRLETTRIDRETANSFLKKTGGAGVKNSVTLSELLKRPEVSYERLKEIDRERPEMKKHEAEELQVRIKYKGYIEKQLAQIERFRKMEDKKLDENMNYREIQGIREEAKQKLEALKPLSLGQASRISGVSPADINVLMIWLEKKKREKKESK